MLCSDGLVKITDFGAWFNDSITEDDAGSLSRVSNHTACLIFRRSRGLLAQARQGPVEPGEGSGEPRNPLRAPRGRNSDVHEPRAVVGDQRGEEDRQGD